MQPIAIRRLISGLHFDASLFINRLNKSQQTALVAEVQTQPQTWSDSKPFLASSGVVPYTAPNLKQGPWQTIQFRAKARFAQPSRIPRNAQSLARSRLVVRHYSFDSTFYYGAVILTTS